MSLRSIVKQVPVVGRLTQWAMGRIAAFRFNGSQGYWERRYRSGGTSGSGSYGRLATFKAEVLNAFIADYGVTTVVEFGCGDGAQLSLFECPKYRGLDISPTVIASCRDRFSGDSTKSFGVFGVDAPGKHDLALSLDVVFHLVEDQVFEAHMTALFESASRFVAVYSSNTEEQAPQPHVRHRRFTDWIQKNRPEWNLIKIVPNTYPFDPRAEDETSFAEFYFFGRV